MADTKPEMTYSERYKTGTLLGRGGMGEVYVAWDQMLSCEVALKLIRTELCEDPRMRRRFNREARAFAFLRHEHIVEVYDFGQTENEQLYLSMELIRGESLHALQGVELPLSIIVQTVCELLDALAHAHARGLVHRDLKAENVLLVFKEDKLFTKLVDFGLATLPAYAEQGLTQGGALFGTPGYMAPEQVRSGADSVGPATDVYAVGVILYELLSGHLPFEGKTSVDTIVSQLNDPVPPINWRPHLRSLSVEIKQCLQKIVEQAMAKKTWERFVSAVDFKRALMQLPLSEEALPECAIISELRSKGMARTGENNFERSSSPDIAMKVRALESGTDSGPGRKHSSNASGPGSNWRHSSQETPNSQTSQAQSSSCEVFDGVSESLGSMQRRVVYDKAATPSFHSAMVGRRFEEEALNFLASQCLEGKGAVQLIAGKFGIGKTRLMRQFFSNWQEKDVNFVFATCQSGFSGGYQVDQTQSQCTIETLTAIVSQLIVVDALEDGEVLGYVREYLKRLGMSARDGFDQSLASLLRPSCLGLKDQDHSSLGNEAILKEIDVLTDFFVNVSRDRAIFMLIDDIHCCDEVVYDLIAKINLHCEHARVLILASYDPSEINALRPESLRVAEMPRFKQFFDNALKLGPMMHEAMIELLQSGLSIEAGSAEEIADLSHGNPLYALALSQSLRKKSRLLMTPQGVYQINPNEERPLEVPDIVVRYYQCKIDSIGALLGTHFDFYREILLRTSVLGYKLDYAELEAFWSKEEDLALVYSWNDALKAWRDYGILIPVEDETPKMEEGLFDEPDDEDMHVSMVFCEPWLVDILQSSVSSRKLRNLHRQAALALKIATQEPDYQQWGRIAYHWDLGRERSEFCLACARSARAAARAGDFRFARERYAELYALYEKKLVDREGSAYNELWRIIDWAEILSDYAEVCIILGEYEELDALLDQISYMSVRERAPKLGAIVQLLHAKLDARRGAFDSAAEHANIARQLFEGCDEKLWASRTLITTAEICYSSGAMAEAKRYSAMAGDALARYATRVDMGCAMAMSAKIEAIQGHFKASQSLATRAQDVFIAEGYPLKAAQMQGLKCANRLIQTFDPHIDDELLALSSEFDGYGDSESAVLCQCYRVVLALADEQWAFAREIMQAIQPFEALVSGVSLLGMLKLLEAFGFLVDGFVADADIVVKEALTAFASCSDWRGELWGLILQSIIALRLGNVEQMQATFNRALESAIKTDYALARASMSIAWAAFCLNQGRHDEAVAASLDGIDQASQIESPIAYTVCQIIGIEASAKLGSIGSLHGFCDVTHFNTLPKLIARFALPCLRRAHEQLTAANRYNHQALAEQIARLHRNLEGAENNFLQEDGSDEAFCAPQSHRNTLELYAYMKNID